ncbi:hypothetical protein [Variovorax paradoxus]|nr:hypothetical protein [Variovorax paradoxus]
MPEPIRQRFASAPREDSFVAAPTLNFFENRQEQELKGNLGLVSIVREQAHMTWQQGQLLLIVGSDVGREKTVDNSARARFRRMTLCGLVPVFSESAVGLRLNNTVIVPAGKSFVPFDTALDASLSHRYRLSKFDGDVATLCAPSPSKTFSYRTETERQVKEVNSRGPDFNKQVTINDSVTCRTGSDVQPLSQLNPGAKGLYLRVECEHKDNVENLQRRSLAWLVDAGMYLPLEEVGWQGTIKTRYARFGYATPTGAVSAQQ